MRLFNLLLLLAFLVLSCDPIEIDNTSTDPQTVYSEIFPISSFANGHFIDSEGNEIFPWGYNYTNAEGVGLIEDDWHNTDTWNLIIEDFEDMKRYSANIVRIHLQYNQFMLDVNTPNTENLNKLNDLVAVAEEIGLYLDITGLAAYRKSDSPEWYDSLSDQERWETQQVFWKNIAQTVGGSKAVFAYNLINEPVVGVGCTTVAECEWLPGDGFGGFYFVQNISLDPANTFAETIKEWSSQMTEAIRAVDQKTMITIGFLNLGDIKQFDTHLDYVSSHIYPKSEEIEESINFIENNQTTPLIIEETGNLNCSIIELEEFLDAIDGKYHGLLGHYHGTPIPEMNNFDIRDALRKNYINMMIDRDPNQ